MATCPVPLTPFVGRAAERATLAEALQAHRLVTAVGPGGVGKTRLALSVAADMVDRFADGVWYVDLVPVADPAMVAPAIADALGLGEPQGRSITDHLLGWLADREALLVLDNCEHLLDGVVVLLERLLVGSSRSGGPRDQPGPVARPVRMGVLGARPLRPSRGRRPRRRGPAVPGTGRLRGQAHRLRRLRPIAAICGALDGMALAIELAAARFARSGWTGWRPGSTTG